MVVIKQLGPNDEEQFAEMIEEVAPMFEEPIQIKRWESETGGDAALGQKPTQTYQLIPTSASIEDVPAAEVVSPNSIYAMGDIRIQTKVEVFGEESETGDFQASGRRADRIVYRNREYRIVGHVQRQAFGSRVVYFSATIRQVGVQKT